MALLALAYFVCAVLCLRLAVAGTNATAIWVPTGIAMAAVLGFGPGVWPGIFAGAFAANALALSGLGLPPAALLGTALATAAGNTAEALLAGFLVRRAAGRHPFGRVAHALWFILFGAVLATLVSALVGAAAFCAATGQWHLFRSMGAAWWVGDASGALVVAPLLVTFRKGDLAALPRAAHRDAALAAVLTLAYWFGVCPLLPSLAFLFLPLLVLGTLRLGSFYGSALVALLAGLATWATVHGTGPFILAGSPWGSLLLQQGFIATLATTTLVLASALQERRVLEAKLVLRNRLYRTLSEVNQAIVHAQERAGLLGEACRLLVEHGGFCMVWAGAMDPDCGRVRPEASAGRLEGYLDSIVVRWDDSPEGRGPSGQAIRTGRGAIVRDCLADPAFASWRDSAAARGYRTCCSCPIRRNGAVAGVLVFYHPDVDAIGGEEGRLLEDLAADLGYALDALEAKRDLVTAQAQTVQRASQLAALNTVAAGMNRSLDLASRCQAALDGALEAAAPDLALLFLREDGELRLMGAQPGPGGLRHDATAVHQAGQCLCGLGARTGQALYAVDIGRDPRCTWDECRRCGVKSFAALPLKGEGAVLGVLGLASATPRDFQAQATFLETLAAQVATGIQNGLLHQRLKDHAAHLEQSVAERTAQLQEANAGLAGAAQRAMAADHAKSAFLSAMSHELRTPLNSVIGFTGVLLGGLAGELRPEQVEPLRIVQRNGRHLLELINDVLDLSKIEAEEMRLSALPFDLVQVLDEALESLAPAAAAKGLALVRGFQAGPLALTGDRRRVAQILLNLLSNAVKFTEAGSVSLGLALEGSLARVQVQDTGPGIRAEDLPRLFREFEQLDAGLARRSEGTGLGLALSRRLARLMGGDIRVASQPGQGSTFTLTLPLGARP